jgi:hypothetical protein
MPPGTEQRQALRGTLQQLATDLQGVLAGQAPQAQMGEIPQQVAQMGNQQVSQQELPGGTNQNAQAQAQALSGIVKSMVGNVANKAKVAPFSQNLSNNKLSQSEMEWLVSMFESSAVPFTMANLKQFKSELASAVTQPTAQPVARSKVGHVIWQKRK